MQHCILLGYVTVWKVKEEERDFEFQGTYTLYNLQSFVKLVIL